MKYFKYIVLGLVVAGCTSINIIPPWASESIIPSWVSEAPEEAFWKKSMMSYKLLAHGEFIKSEENQAKAKENQAKSKENQTKSYENHEKSKQNQRKIKQNQGKSSKM